MFVQSSFSIAPLLHCSIAKVSLVLTCDPFDGLRVALSVLKGEEWNI